jgi:hypothetical protein
MTEQEQLSELERELAGCHEHGAHEYEHLAETLERHATQLELAGQDAAADRLAARRVRAAGQRYREEHQCHAS